jgi:DNA polymerase-1
MSANQMSLPGFTNLPGTAATSPLGKALRRNMAMICSATQAEHVEHEGSVPLAQVEPEQTRNSETPCPARDFTECSTVPLQFPERAPSRISLTKPPKRAMRYEDYLVACRTGTLDVRELDRLARLKTLSRDIDAHRHLSTWLEQHAGRIEVITEVADAVAEIAALKAMNTVIGIDIETAKGISSVDHPQAGLHPAVSRIRLVQLFAGKEHGVIVIDCFAAGYDWLASLVGGRYVAHNASFECAHFWRHLKQELEIDCTMLAGRVFYGELRKLADLAREELDLTLSKTLQVSDWSRQGVLDEQIMYAAADAVVARLLWNGFMRLFAESDAKYRRAYDFLKALVYPVIRQAGVGFDINGHAQVVADWQREEQEARQTLFDLGLSNPASIKQTQAWLAERLSVDDLMEWPLTDSGNLKTAAEVLDQALHIPGARPLARWSQVSTRLANFGPKLADLMIDGCLYPNYRIAGMVSGRFGCNNPNIQNQPRKGFKHLYRAPPGYQFITGDLSQIELRVAGLISGDSVINEAYAQGRDLHREVAAERAGKLASEISDEERRSAKAINFGLLFGAGAPRLREQAINSYHVEMSMEDAKEAKAFFHAKYARLTEWQQEAVAMANAMGCSESPFVKLTRHYDREVYTHAMNFPVQSGAWEVLALAIGYIDRHLPTDGSIRISHHVYDELCLVAKDDQVLPAALLLRDGFLHGFQTVFPTGSTRGLVEIGAGPTWKAAGSDENRIKEASL